MRRQVVITLTLTVLILLPFQNCKVAKNTEGPAGGFPVVALESVDDSGMGDGVPPENGGGSDGTRTCRNTFEMLCNYGVEEKIALTLSASWVIQFDWPLNRQKFDIAVEVREPENPDSLVYGEFQATGKNDFGLAVFSSGPLTTTSFSAAPGMSTSELRLNLPNDGMEEPLVLPGTCQVEWVSSENCERNEN